MDKNKIFKLFEENSNTLDIFNSIDTSFKKNKLNPTFKIGMFTKLILNHQVFHIKLEKFLKEEETEFNIKSTKEASEFVVFNRAWFYLNQVNPSSKEDILAILDFNPKLLNNALENSLIYFENGEEYLKCAHIFKIQQILRERK